MSEFMELWKEALYKTEPFDVEPQRQQLEQSIQQFNRRLAVVRWMTLIPIVFMTGLGVWSAVSFLNLPQTASAKAVLLPVAGFLIAIMTIGMQKYWMMMMHNHLATMKELKRVQLMVLDRPSS